MSSTDGAMHIRLRRMVARLLSKPALNAAEDGVRGHVQKLVAALAADRREFEMVSEIAKPVAAKTVGGLMGLSDDVAMALGSWVEVTFRSLDPGDELSAQSAGPRMMRSNLAKIRVLTVPERQRRRSRAGVASRGYTGGPRGGDPVGTAALPGRV